MVSKVRSLVWYEAVCNLLLFVLAVGGISLDEAGRERERAWLSCGFLRPLFRLFICFAEGGSTGLLGLFASGKLCSP